MTKRFLSGSAGGQELADAQAAGGRAGGRAGEGKIIYSDVLLGPLMSCGIQWLSCISNVL